MMKYKIKVSIFTVSYFNNIPYIVKPTRGRNSLLLYVYVS